MAVFQVSSRSVQVPWLSRRLYTYFMCFSFSLIPGNILGDKRQPSCYPVVMVPSALTRMDMPGRGVWAGPCTTLKLCAGSKMALCAGQTSC